MRSCSSNMCWWTATTSRSCLRKARITPWLTFRIPTKARALPNKRPVRRNVLRRVRGYVCIVKKAYIYVGFKIRPQLGLSATLDRRSLRSRFFRFFSFFLGFGDLSTRKIVLDPLLDVRWHVSERLIRYFSRQPKTRREQKEEPLTIHKGHVLRCRLHVLHLAIAMSRWDIELLGDLHPAANEVVNRSVSTLTKKPSESPSSSQHHEMDYPRKSESRSRSLSLARQEVRRPTG